MPILTIYTPTYNRKLLLSRVYDSLRAQTNKDFIWMIVDDGSTDGTKDYIESISNNDNEFSICYYYKENGGVHTARDFAIKHCNTELITNIDSDDWVVDNTVSFILDTWSIHKNECIGIITPRMWQNGKTVCTNYPQDGLYEWQDIYFKYGCSGDTMWIYQTCVVSQTENTPSFEGEKLVGELYRNLQEPIANAVFYVSNISLTITDYQQDGISACPQDNMFKNPNGFRSEYGMLIKNAKYLKGKIKGYIGYIACSIIIGDKRYIKESQKPLITALMTPFGALGLMYLEIRRRKAHLECIR